MKPYPAFCNDCKFSRPDRGSEWRLVCAHPRVNAGNAYALASPKIPVASCREERARGFFAPCGKRGRMWEAK